MYLYAATSVPDLNRILYLVCCTKIS